MSTLRTNTHSSLRNTLPASGSWKPSSTTEVRFSTLVHNLANRAGIRLDDLFPDQLIALKKKDDERAKLLLALQEANNKIPDLEPIPHWLQWLYERDPVKPTWAQHTALREAVQMNNSADRRGTPAKFTYQQKKELTALLIADLCDEIDCDVREYATQMLISRLRSGQDARAALSRDWRVINLD